MEEEAKRRLKAAELQAKKSRLRIWTNYVPPATNSKAIHNQNFTGKVNCLYLVLIIVYIVCDHVNLRTIFDVIRWWKLLVGTALLWQMIPSLMAVHWQNDV